MINKPHGIIVFGANGSGKTTLGRELARILNFKRMDVEDYYFEEAEIPYTKARSSNEVLKLMLADIEKYGSFVLSSVKGDWGEEITSMCKLGVYITAPLELRLERIEQRSYDRYGTRILKGGDMYEQEQKFFDFAASRSLLPIEQWTETLVCPVIRVDGTADWRGNAVNIAERFMQIIK